MKRIFLYFSVILFSVFLNPSCENFNNGENGTGGQVIESAIRIGVSKATLDYLEDKETDKGLEKSDEILDLASKVRNQELESSLEELVKSYIEKNLDDPDYKILAEEILYWADPAFNLNGVKINQSLVEAIAVGLERGANTYKDSVSTSLNSSK